MRETSGIGDFPIRSKKARKVADGSLTFIGKMNPIRLKPSLALAIENRVVVSNTGVGTMRSFGAAE